MEETHDIGAIRPFGPSPSAITPVLPGSVQSPPPVPTVAATPAASHASRRWMVLLAICAALLAGPYIAGQFVYQAAFNELKAGYDVATGALDELKPRLNDLSLASRLIAKRVEPSVVSIFRPTGDGFDGQGSGVVVDAEGYIVTNFHVVEGTKTVRVQFTDGRKAAATVVGADEPTDLAVLKVSLPNLIAAEWGDSNELEVGDLVWALGSPYGLDHSLTFGIVSAKDRRSGTTRMGPMTRQSLYQEYLQTDAAVNPGNSGGPLVNIDGQIIGINAAIFGNAYQGISFAIPSALAREKYQELREKGAIVRAWLGISPLQVPDEVRERLGLKLGEGVYVGSVERTAPAGRNGIQKGDVILKWNDHVASDPTLLSRAIAATEIGSTARIVLARGRAGTGEMRQVELDIKVELRPPDSF